MKKNKTIEAENKSTFASIINACKMGEVLCDTQKQKNDWKLKMLKAGLGEGMILPEDFDSLPEDEKERRLNGAINALK